MKTDRNRVRWKLSAPCVWLTLIFVVGLKADDARWLRWIEEAGQLQRAGDLNAATARLAKALPEAEGIGTLDLVLNNLASVLHDLGRYAEAERYYLRCIAIVNGRTKVEDLARVVNNLATLYLETGRCTEAEKLFRRFPSDGPAGLPHNGLDYGNWLNNNGSVQLCLGNYKKAEQLHLQALTVYDGSVGSDHFAARAARANLALAYQHGGQYEKTLALLRAGLTAAEQSASGGDRRTTNGNRQGLR